MIGRRVRHRGSPRSGRACAVAPPRRCRGRVRPLRYPDGKHRPLEIKTAYDDTDWGTPGTDEIPLYYRTQTVTLDVPVLRAKTLYAPEKFALAHVRSLAELVA